MNVDFPPVDEGYIKAKVKSGCYVDESELIRDAVRRMRKQDEKREQPLAALEAGEEDIEAGRYRAYNSDLLGEIVERQKRQPLAEGPNPMLPPAFTLVLAARAQDDFEDIISYTAQTWGEQQAALNSAAICQLRYVPLAESQSRLPKQYRALRVRI
jgi:antitoxin ParD1/3/4